MNSQIRVETTREVSSIGIKEASFWGISLCDWRRGGAIVRSLEPITARQSTLCLVVWLWTCCIM